MFERGLRPGGFVVELNGTVGLIKMKWDPVPSAKGYVVECSLDVQPRVFTLLANTTKSAAEKQLTVGEVYSTRSTSKAASAFAGVRKPTPWSVSQSKKAKA